MTSKPNLLHDLKKYIQASEYRLLALEGGFQPPNNFCISRIASIVDNCTLPDSDHFEYMWAINESSRKNIERMSIPMRVLVAAIFVYCNKKRDFGMTLESEYYRIGLSALFEDVYPDLNTSFLEFLEWLHYDVTPAEGYEDYFNLLARVYMLAHLRQTGLEKFEDSLRQLAIKSEQVTEDELTDAENGLSWWRDINPIHLGGDDIKRQLVSVLPA